MRTNATNDNIGAKSDSNTYIDTDNAPPMNKIKESLRYTHISEHIPGII